MLQSLSDIYWPLLLNSRISRRKDRLMLTNVTLVVTYHYPFHRNIFLRWVFKDRFYNIIMLLHSGKSTQSRVFPQLDCVNITGKLFSRRPLTRNSQLRKLQQVPLLHLRKSIQVHIPTNPVFWRSHHRSLLMWAYLKSNSVLSSMVIPWWPQ